VYRSYRDELLGAYSKAEDNALSAAFGGRGKKRLNKVFDAIGFIYPDYRYPLRGQQKKRKIAASVTPVDPVPKGKKMKVLTHRPCYIESAVVPDFGAGSSSAAKAIQTASTVQGAEEPTVLPKTHIVEPVEDKVEKAEEPKIEEKMSKILSPPIKPNLSKTQKTSAATPKRRRMANVLDAVLETTQALSPALVKKIAPTETKSQVEAETRHAEAEAMQVQAEAEAGPSVPTETEPAALEEKAT
jgi:hypothetical protein